VSPTSFLQSAEGSVFVASIEPIAPTANKPKDQVTAIVGPALVRSLVKRQTRHFSSCLPANAHVNALSEHADVLALSAP
jgi:hypothetical protein